MASTHSFLPSFSSLQCLGVSRAVPGLLALFLVVEQPLLHPKVHNYHPAHLTISSSNSVALLPLALEKQVMEHKFLHVSQHSVFALICSKNTFVILYPILHFLKLHFRYKLYIILLYYNNCATFSFQLGCSMTIKWSWSYVLSQFLKMSE